MTSHKKEKTTNKTTVERIKKHQAEFLQALDLASLNVSVACKKISISRNTFYLWVKDYPEFKQAVEDQKEADKDFVETQIRRQILEGNTTMLIFYAKTQMKDRGYIEKSEIGVSGDGTFVEMMRAASERFNKDETPTPLKNE